MQIQNNDNLDFMRHKNSGNRGGKNREGERVRSKKQRRPNQHASLMDGRREKERNNQSQSKVERWLLPLSTGKPVGGEGRGEDVRGRAWPGTK